MTYQYTRDPLIAEIKADYDKLIQTGLSVPDARARILRSYNDIDYDTIKLAIPFKRSN